MGPRNQAFEEESFRFSQIPLEVLISSPICWNGPKSCQFFDTAWNWIKDDDTMKDFRRKLNTSHLYPDSEWRIWPRGSTWEKVLGQEHFNLVTTRFIATKNASEGGRLVVKKETEKVNSTSIVDLLRTIRNKHQHNAHYKESNVQLKWFRHTEVNGGQSLQFDEGLFATYWVNKFPQLLTYLWWHFRIFRDLKTEKDAEVQKFYPCPITASNGFHFMMFLDQINGAMTAQLERGGLDARYMYGKEPVSSLAIEFRQTAQTDLVLDGSSFLEVEISSDFVSFKWFKQTHQGIELVDKRSTIGISSVVNITLNIFIAKKLSDLDEGLLVDKCKPNTVNTHRIIILTSSDYQNNANEILKREKIVKHVGLKCKLDLIEVPVNWQELSTKTKNTLIDTGSFSLQDKIIKLSHILPKGDTKDKILSHLKGGALNELLKFRSPVILGKHTVPVPPSLYFERLISKRIIVEREKISENANNHAYLITNFNYLSMHRIFPDKKDVDVNENFELLLKSKSTSSIFYLDRDIEKSESEDLFHKLVNSKEGSKRKVCCVRYLGGESFELLWEANNGNESSKRKPMQENEFLKCLDENQKNIFIADKPGMGKSLVLYSLARQLCETIANSFVLVVPMTDFVTQVATAIKSKTLNKSIIIQEISKLVSSTHFDRNLMGFWLSLKEKDSSKLAIEIMLDGLDEVKLEHRDLTTKMLNVIKKDLPSVRVWATLREHMLDNLRVNFNTLGYKLKPFSDEKKIDFLEKYWQQQNEIQERHSSQVLRDFAKKCINLPLTKIEADITGVPLQCRMLAEVYEQKVMDGDLTIDDDSSITLVDLYDKLIERKMEVYLREKKGLSRNISINDTFLNPMLSQMDMCHVYYSLKLVVGEKFANEFKHRLVVTSSTGEQLELTVLEQGIIEKVNPLTFIHRTFAEFFLARFIFKVKTGQYFCITEEDSSFQDLLWNELLQVMRNTRTGSDVNGDPIGIISSDFKFETVFHFYNALWNQNIQDSQRSHLLVSQNCLKLVKKVIDSFTGRPIYGPEFCKIAPLLAAAYYKKYQSVLALIVNSPTRKIEIFVIALIQHEYEFVRYLIENNVGFEPQNWYKLQEYDDHKFGILHWLVYGLNKLTTTRVEPGLEPFVRYVVGKDQTVVSLKDAKGRTPLLLFLQEGTINTVMPGVNLIIKTTMHSMLVELGADLLTTDTNKNTVLHVTDHDITTFIDDTKMERFMSYSLVLMFTMKSGRVSSLINAVNSEGHTPLVSAIVYFESMLIRILHQFRKAGANFNLKDSLGNTALHVAVERNLSLEFVRELIFCGSDVSIVNAKGQSVLHLAVEKGFRMELVRMLIEKFNVDMDLKDNEGKSVLQYQTTDSFRDFLGFQYRVQQKKKKKEEKKKHKTGK